MERGITKSIEILFHHNILIFSTTFVLFMPMVQVTIALKISAQPAYVATRTGLLKVSGLFINIHGVKLPITNEAGGGKISLEQSQSDRSKKPFNPMPVAVLSNEITKVTVGRLHFTETTANNMRKKGRPNPDQRYFALVVTLAARAGDALYTIASHLSEKIIVRASNPGQFETESNIHWVRGESLNSIFHNGPVGINVDCPEDALCVRGNIRYVCINVLPLVCTCIIAVYIYIYIVL